MCSSIIDIAALISLKHQEEEDHLRHRQQKRAGPLKWRMVLQEEYWRSLHEQVEVQRKG